jgi:hypothetical protein
MARRFNIEVEVSSKGIRKLEKQLEGVKREAGQTSRGMRQMQSQLRLLARTAAVAGVAMAGIFVKDAIRKAAEQERVMRGVEATIKSTGGAAGLTAEQIAEMAAKLQKVSVFGDEAILAMQNILLTFKNIRGEAFEKTTKAVLDMATVMGTDLKSAALQLGKALNDPTKRMAELSRTGVTFSESQIEAVKAMEKAGDVAGAQSLILKELESQFGGTAAAARDTLGGALKALGNEFGDLQEMLVAETGSGGALRTAVEAWIKALQWLKENWAEIEAFIFWVIGNIASAVTAFVAVFVQQFGQLWQAITFGLGGASNIGTMAIEAAESIRRLGEDIQEGMKIKATAALSPMVSLSTATGGLATEAEKASKEIERLAKLKTPEIFRFVPEATRGFDQLLDSLSQYEALVSSVLTETEQWNRQIAEAKALMDELAIPLEIQEEILRRINQQWADQLKLIDDVNKKSIEWSETFLTSMLDAMVMVAQAWSSGVDDMSEVWRRALVQMSAAFVQEITTKAFASLGALSGPLGALAGGLAGGIVGKLFGGTSSAEKRQKRRRREAEALARAEEEAALRARALAIKIGELAFEMREGVKEAIEFSRQLRAIGEDPGIAFQELAANLQAMRNGILGINETAEERIRRQAEEFNRELALIKAENTAKLAELQITLAILQAEQGAVNAHLQASKAYVMGITGVASATAVSADLIAGAMASIEASIGEIENLLAALPAAISEEEITKAIKRTRRSTKGFASSIGKIGPTMEEAKQSIEEFLESLKGGSSISALPPLTQIQNLQKQFVGLVNQALGGNVQAANQLPQIAQQLLSLAQQFSPALFVQLSQFVQAMLMKVLGKGGEVQSFQGGGVVEGSGAQMALLHPPEAVVPLKGGSVPVEFKTPSVVPQTRILREIKSELVRHRHERRSDRLHRRATDRRILAQPPALPVDGVHVTRPPL